jgi:hypothetical protein
MVRISAAIVATVAVVALSVHSAPVGHLPEANDEPLLPRADDSPPEDSPFTDPRRRTPVADPNHVNQVAHPDPLVGNLPDPNNEPPVGPLLPHGLLQGGRGADWAANLRGARSRARRDRIAAQQAPAAIPGVDATHRGRGLAPMRGLGWAADVRGARSRARRDRIAAQQAPAAMDANQDPAQI